MEGDMQKETATFLDVSWSLTNDSPKKVLEEIGAKYDLNVTSEEYAVFMDENDKLRDLKNQFIFPALVDSNESIGVSESCVYLAGNALGLQPQRSSGLLSEVLQNWARNAVECHFVEPLPAALCDNYVEDQLARLVGANEGEIAAMNGNEVNLHLMLVSFYLPSTKRKKILVDDRSNKLCIAQSHIAQYGFDAGECILPMPYRNGKDTVKTEDIVDVIQREGESIATILLPGVLPISGQLLNIEEISKAGHEKGCMVGFDLDDAVGNAELRLHEWGVDFACWTSSKFLNSGPASMGCAFLHEKHANNDFHKFLGWWGHKYSTRFQMSNHMELSPGIQGYKISNQPPVLVAPLKVSLDIFDMTSMRDIREKTFLLTGYLEYLLKRAFPKPRQIDQPGVGVDIITPCDSVNRGAQISFKVAKQSMKVYHELKKRGFICKTFKPDVISVCPAPLYCGFRDVQRFVSSLRDVILHVA